MALYDSNHNQVHVTVAPPGKAGRVHEVLKDRLIRPNLAGPDENGLIVISFRDVAASEESVAIRDMLAREFPDGEERITVEWIGS
jgi:hypothetical protein